MYNYMVVLVVRDKVFSKNDLSFRMSSKIAS